MASSTTTVNAAPSWPYSTLEWVKYKDPANWVGVRRGRDTDKLRLKHYLIKVKFQKVESVIAGESDEGYHARIDSLVSVWDEELHRQLVEFHNDGGYDHEKTMLPKSNEVDEFGMPVGGAKKVGPRRTRPTLEQEVSEVIEQTRILADPRAGAW